MVVKISVHPRCRESGNKEDGAEPLGLHPIQRLGSPHIGSSTDVCSSSRGRSDADSSSF